MIICDYQKTTGECRTQLDSVVFILFNLLEEESQLQP